MGPDSNTQITTENPISLVNQKIDFLENQMVEMYGNKRYKSADGFTQEEIYAYAGTRWDEARRYVATERTGTADFANRYK